MRQLITAENDPGPLIHTMSLKIENYYDHIKTKDDGLRHYPNEDKLNIKLPFRMLVQGPSGSGKTNALLNLIKHVGIFDKIILLAKHLDEPLYKHLIDTYAKIEKKLKVQMMLAISTAKDMPEVEDCNEKENTLLIVDDMICEDKKELAKIGKFWTQARKKGVSMVFISQSYYAVPKIIRQNTQHILIKKIDTPKDLRAILAESSLGIDQNELLRLYQHALSQGDPHTAFFMIDTATPKKSLRFRANFEPILSD
jgi:DNA helicase HerA-like ATPase